MDSKIHPTTQSYSVSSNRLTASPPPYPVSGSLRPNGRPGGMLGDEDKTPVVEPFRDPDFEVTVVARRPTQSSSSKPVKRKTPMLKTC